MDDISLRKLNRREGARYMGYGEAMPDAAVSELIDECEKAILASARPRYIYRVFDIEAAENIKLSGTGLVLTGNSIKELLEGCKKAALICATLSGDMDKLIKLAQVQDMAKAVVMDAFAGVAVEQLCDSVEERLREHFKDKYFTYRFGVGYGDLPLELIGDFLSALNAYKAIGVTVTGGNMMSPSKSVACIVGISDEPIKSKKRGCITCAMRESCQYRIKGERCGF